MRFSESKIVMQYCNVIFRELNVVWEYGGNQKWKLNGGGSAIDKADDDNLSESHCIIFRK